MDRKFKQATEEEFWDFIKNYPNRLVEEPGDCITYNDYSLGFWPASVIGRLYHTFIPESGKFEILINFKEIKEEKFSRIKKKIEI